MSEKVLAREGRVIVRKFKRSDLADRSAWPPYRDPLNTHLNFDLSTFIDRERWLFTRKANAGRMYFAIEDEQGRLIGEMSLRDIESHEKTSRLGIHLASNKVSQGYGREALAGLLTYYFDNMKWNTMYLDVAAFNFRAIRLYERLHFERMRDFWRRISADDCVLTAPEYAHIRHLMRRAPGGIEALHHDMLLTKERYFETLAQGTGEHLVAE